MITINSRKYDGTIRRSWRCELIDRVESMLVFIGEFDVDIQHADLGHIKKGTTSHEYYWLDRWYNVFQFHEPSGELKSYYFNINMPPTFEDGVLDYVDLDIDVLVRPDLSFVILDLDDYERNAEDFGYSAELKAKVEETLADIVKSIEVRHLSGIPELFATSTPEVRESR